MVSEAHSCDSQIVGNKLEPKMLCLLFSTIIVETNCLKLISDSIVLKADETFIFPPRLNESIRTLR